MPLTHVDEHGAARMVDISAKPVQHREAVARAKIFLQPATLELIKANQIKKGDVLAAARLAGIMGGKKTADLIPLCHPIAIHAIDVTLEPDTTGIAITARAICDGRTGIEMEALTAVSIAALTIYDMCKAVDKTMHIEEIRLLHKHKE